MTTEMAPFSFKDVGDSLMTNSIVSERWRSMATRDREDGVGDQLQLGLAWIASPNNDRGRPYGQASRNKKSTSR